MADCIIKEEQSVWEFLKNSKEPVYIYGMGNGGDKVLSLFNDFGIKCSGVLASDDFVRGQSFGGFKVQKLSQAQALHKKLVVAVTFGTQLPAVMEHIKNIAKENVVVVPTVPVFGNVIVDRAFLENNSSSIKKAYDLLQDDFSKEVFENILNFNYSGKLPYLWQCESGKKEVFDNIIKLNHNEKYLDLGAYRGDTIQEFLQHSGGQYSSITALEPDIKTYKKLCEYGKALHSTALLQQGIYSDCGTVCFDSQGGRNSTLQTGKGGTQVQVTTIDALCESGGVTYIKMDVEGAEKSALLGGVNTLQKYKPKLNIAAYHTFGDLFNLILQVNMINHNYKFYLRHHPYIPAWDTNLYCV